MTELPRSRALVRLDGPGHIMPVEPVTPPGSKVWRVIHFPVMLAVVAIGLLFVSALAIGLIGFGFRFTAHIPGVRYLIPLIGATATITAYCLFVRIVERRSDIEELGARGWLTELVLGFCGGLALSFATFAVLSLLGALRVVGSNPPYVMLLPFVVQICTAIVLEIVVCGLGFRLVERLLGSWLTLLLAMIFFGTVRFFSDSQTPYAVLAVALEAGLLFAVLYMVTRRLWAAIGLHAAWKFAQVGLYGDAVTAGEPHGYVLSILDGPDWLTGGRAGTDASIPGLCINALAMVVLLEVAVRRGRIVRPVWQRGRTA
ncbi:type II CAAX prenyl endopeptidase Rce1 family protein [uncultured Sphingomonas sp.]|uniref:CPBP family glutamic-type intramembrane protease n=1 Tax=uncultured Sphingomonas sp. TaxID=158754 RepID=UPI0035CB1CBF